MGKHEPWSYTAGRHGHAVRVYQRRDRKSLYVSVWEHGREVKRSLKHADRQRAMDYADDLSTQIRKGDTEVGVEQPRAARIFALYQEHRTPDKGAYSQGADQRHTALWKAVLGAAFDLSKLSRRQWDAFVRARRSGAIDAKGAPVLEKKRRKVRDRVIEKDCAWLRAVCRWATEFRDDSGRLLLERDPTRGLEIPREKNPARPVASHDRVDAIRAVYRDVQMRVGGKLVESYLPELFEIVVGTGRRVSAVCALRMEDLDLGPSERAPWGAIVWPEDTDKMAKRWRCPISGRVREALEAAKTKRARRGRVGSGPLFPSPDDPEQPVGYHDVATWLRSAETKAGLEPQEGSLWHAYRRLWASSRKDLPDVDVAQAGGWASLEALKMAYQRPDDETMLRVVTHEAELREAR
jgi:integrase